MKLFLSVFFVCLALTTSLEKYKLRAEMIYFKNEIKHTATFPLLYVPSLPAFFPSPWKGYFNKSK